MQPPIIVSVGEVLWDLFPDGERFGGAPANFACHAALAGAKVRMLSAVGNDSRGQKALSILDDYGIETTFVQIHKERPTGSVGITLDQAGKPTFTIHADAAWDSFRWEDRIADSLNGADFCYFGTLGQRSTESRSAILTLVRLAKEQGIRRILDVNLRPPFDDFELIRNSVDQTNLLKISDEELLPVAEACGTKTYPRSTDTLKEIQERKELDGIVMTRGANGAILVDGESVVEQPGIPTDVRDTVGAGDAFTAGFVLGIIAGDPHPTLLKNACETAARVCSIPGAVPPPQRE